MSSNVDDSADPRWDLDRRLQIAGESIMRRLSPKKRQRLRCIEYIRGHLVYNLWRDLKARREAERKWLDGDSAPFLAGSQSYWADTGARVDFGNLRPCARCGAQFAPGAPDPCLGMLPAVKAACCGHGVSNSYIAFENGVVVRGFNAIEDF
jgi:hypothetical protein